MALRWKVIHEQKLVHIVADGEVTAKDIEDHFDDLVRENAMGYAKLFDAMNVDPKYTDHDVLMMGARLSAYTATMESGPLAVFGTSDAVHKAFARFVNMSPSKRPAGLFKTEGQARAWRAANGGPDLLRRQKD